MRVRILISKTFKVCYYSETQFMIAVINERCDKNINNEVECTDFYVMLLGVGYSERHFPNINFKSDNWLSENFLNVHFS